MKRTETNKKKKRKKERKKEKKKKERKKERKKNNRTHPFDIYLCCTFLRFPVLRYLLYISSLLCFFFFFFLLWRQTKKEPNNTPLAWRMAFRDYMFCSHCPRTRKIKRQRSSSCHLLNIIFFFSFNFVFCLDLAGGKHFQATLGAQVLWNGNFRLHGQAQVFKRNAYEIGKNQQAKWTEVFIGQNIVRQ